MYSYIYKIFMYDRLLFMNKKVHIIFSIIYKTAFVCETFSELNLYYKHLKHVVQKIYMLLNRSFIYFQTYLPKNNFISGKSQFIKDRKENLHP